MLALIPRYYYGIGEIWFIISLIIPIEFIVLF